MVFPVKTVAHCATPFAPLFAPWLHAQIRHQQRYRTVVLTQEALNTEHFPVERLRSSEEFGSVKKLFNRVVTRVTGTYPFYECFLTQEQADIIHAHFGYQGVRCMRAKSRTGLPMVTSLYGMDATRDAHRPPWRSRFERLFNAGELFLAEGGHMARRLEGAGCPAERIAIHHLGVDTEAIRFTERIADDGEVRVLMCANFREKKGIPDGLRALGNALQGLRVDCRVVILGDGPEKPKVLEAVRDSGLSERVEMLGIQPYAGVLEQMRRCHFFLHPSVTAADGDAEGGAPVVLLDAQASGLPVIATEHDDIPEYVLDGRSGLLAPERDVDGLSDRIRVLLTAREKWGEMGRQGRRHVEESYNARTQSASLESVYDRVLGQ